MLPAVVLEACHSIFYQESSSPKYIGLHINSPDPSNPELGSNETSGDGSSYDIVGMTFLISSVLSQCRSD